MRLYYIIMSRYVAVYTSDAEVELHRLLNCTYYTACSAPNLSSLRSGSRAYLKT